MSTRAQWAFDLVIGTVVGGVLGIIASLNVLVYSGVGHDRTPTEVFAENVAVGILAAAVLIGGPVGMVVLLRTLRRSRQKSIFR
jgi:hypothetical protein